jgi:hypothetical protein
MSSTSTLKQEQVLADSKKQEQVQATTVKPSATATQPSTTATQPSTTATQPSTTATQPSTTATQPSVTAVKATPNKKVIPPRQVYYDDYSDDDYDDYDEEELEYQLARIPADMRAALDPRYSNQLADFRASCRDYF